MCSISAIVPVRWCAGMASAFLIVPSKAAANAPVLRNCRNVRRSVLMTFLRRKPVARTARAPCSGLRPSALRAPNPRSSPRGATAASGRPRVRVATDDLLAVAGRPAAEDRGDRVARGLAGGQLVGGPGRRVRAGAGALILVEAGVLGLVVRHRHETGGDDV